MISMNTYLKLGLLALVLSFLSMKIEGAAVPTGRNLTVQQSSTCGVSQSVKQDLKAALGSYYIVRATDSTRVRKINATELTRDTAECDGFFKADGDVNQRSECPWDYTIHHEDAEEPNIRVVRPLCARCRNKKHDVNYQCESSWEVTTINKWDGCVYSEERIMVRSGSHCVHKMMTPST